MASIFASLYDLQAIQFIVNCSHKRTQFEATKLVIFDGYQGLEALGLFIKLSNSERFQVKNCLIANPLADQSDSQIAGDPGKPL